MKTNLQLVKWCKAKIGCLYWYGTFGQIASKALYNAKRTQYPTQYLWGYSPSFAGKQVFDCVGLIKGFIWEKNGVIKYNGAQDLSANGMLAKCKKRGKIKNGMPDVAGLLVFCSGHVGVYIGDGYVIEARGHKYGVVKTKLSERSFTDWGYCPYISYEKAPAPPASEYYPIYKGDSLSIVDALKSLNIKSTKAYRKEIAFANGFTSYSGTAKQNEKLLELLKAGKLKKV